MTDSDRDNQNIRDDDRLPWLEAADDVEEESGASTLKLVGGVVAALIVLGIVIAAAWWYKGRDNVVQGDGSLITAPAGDYKTKPDEPGGMKVEGEGDTAFATSEGAEANGSIDTSALPEAPVAGTRAAAPAPAASIGKPAAAVAAKVADGGKLPVPTHRAATQNRAIAADSNGSLIQLGAYGSEASANQAWDKMSKRFGFIAPLSKSVIPVKIGENTLYRLRADAGASAQAKAICGKLRVAGENCLVIGN